MPEVLFSPPVRGKGIFGDIDRTSESFADLLSADANKHGVGGIGAETWRTICDTLVPHRLPSSVESGLCIRPPRGILLYGPPGTGKTRIATALRDMLGAKFAVINGPQMLQKWVGEAESGLRAYFDECRADPDEFHVIFIDELDSIAPNRSSLSSDGSSNTLRGLVTVLLTELDGIRTDQVQGRFLVIGATNRPESVDPALLRPGRFNPMIEISPPDRDGRLEILDIHTRDIRANGRLAADVNLAAIADATHDFVGAGLKALVDRAAIRCAVEYAPLIQEKWAESEPMSQSSSQIGGSIITCPIAKAKALLAAERGQDIAQVAVTNVSLPVFPECPVIYGTPEYPQRIGIPPFPMHYELPQDVREEGIPLVMGREEYLRIGMDNLLSHLCNTEDPGFFGRILEEYQTNPVAFCGIIENTSDGASLYRSYSGVCAPGGGGGAGAAIGVSSRGGGGGGSQSVMVERKIKFPFVKVAQRHLLEALAFMREKEYNAPDIIRDCARRAHRFDVPALLASAFQPMSTSLPNFRPLVVKGGPKSGKTSIVCKAALASDNAVQSFKMVSIDDFLSLNDLQRSLKLRELFETSKNIRAPAVLIIDVHNAFFTDHARYPLSAEAFEYILSETYWEQNRKPSKLFVCVIILPDSATWSPPRSVPVVQL